MDTNPILNVEGRRARVESQIQRPRARQNRSVSGRKTGLGGDRRPQFQTLKASGHRVFRKFHLRENPPLPPKRGILNVEGRESRGESPNPSLPNGRNDIPANLALRSLGSWFPSLDGFDVFV